MAALGLCCCARLSLVAVSRGYSLLRCAGSSLRRLLLLQSMGSRRAAFSSCGRWAQQLWHTGLVPPRHVGSSRTRDQTRVPCIGRRILNHCTTREVSDLMILKQHLYADGSKIYVSYFDFSPVHYTHISNYLLNISALMSSKYRSRVEVGNLIADF